MHRLFSFVAACVVVAASACTTFDTATGDPDAGTNDDAGPSTSRDGAIGSCGPANCPGCCFANVCQPGTTAAACGRGGGLCAVCQIDQICRTEGQACGLDLDSNWMVQPVSAEIAAKKNGTAAWDIDSSPPDPYPRLACPSDGTVKDGAFVADTTKAAWTGLSCVLKARDLITKGFLIGVRDDDFGSNEVIAADTTVKVTEAELLAGGKVISQAPNLSTLQIKLTRQP